MTKGRGAMNGAAKEGSAQTRGGDAAGAPPPNTKGNPPRRGMTRLVLELIRPYRSWLIIVFIAMLIETVMSFASPWPLKVILDSVVGKHKLPEFLAWLRGYSSGEETMGLAAVAALGYVLIAGIGAVAGYIENYYTESVGQWVANDLRLRMYHHLHRLSLSYYDTHQSGTLLSTITADVATIQGFASSSTLAILVDILTIIGILAVMLWLNFDFAMIAVGVTPFLLFFLARFKKAVKKATHEVRKRQSDIVAVVQQGLESMRTVKAYGRQEQEESELSAASHETVAAALKARRVKSLLSPIVAVTVSLVVAFVLWRSASLILAGAMTVGALTVFLSYLNKFFKPVQDLAKMTNAIAQTAVGLDRIRAILDTDTIIPERPDAREPGTVRGGIVFEKVAFAYDPESPVLREVNLTMAPGQRVGVVGPTGGGKSTLVSLIPRFYDTTGGRVLLDGTDIRDYTLQGVRRQIGFVLQDTTLFHGTVRENISFGRDGATEEEIHEAARLANADEFITKMADGYDTLVGERGSTLSGGQRQRIGIARAVLRNAPILILDEPTAALDTESEKLVMEALERLMKGRTVITIAHRLSTIRDFDKIVVLKGGLVAEEGSHEELLARNGVYAELYRIQVEGGASSQPQPDSQSATNT
jgi:ABC-type multidrug transport system fused ATPase/permease subunit